MLFEVDNEGWDALDKKEGAPSVYERVAVEVLNERGESLKAVTYAVCKARKEAFVKPDPGYVERSRAASSQPP